MDDATRFERQPVESCADCGAPEAPYAYLQDGRHYCIRCARVKLIRDQIRPAGQRHDDLTLDDVLFRELPLGPVDGPDGSTPAEAKSVDPLSGPLALDLSAQPDEESQAS